MTSCPTLHTGAQFLSSSLALLDCEGRNIGAYGYGALAAPFSGVSIAMGGLLTLFVALFGIRLMMGEPMGGRNAVGAVLRFGIVLTLATSWPAWRIIGYDLVLDGPAEIASAVMGASLPSSVDGTMAVRLQRVDDAILSMTRLSNRGPFGAYVDQNAGPYGDTPDSVALGDKTGFAWGRISFLAGSIAPFAVIRISAGLLLALAPLMAGLLLFGETYGLFIGWLRGLVFVMIASIFYQVTMAVELAMLEPWIGEALRLRADGAITPSIPTELLVLTLAGVVSQVGLMALIGRVAFHPATAMKWIAPLHGAIDEVVVTRAARSEGQQFESTPGAPAIQHNRVSAIADAVSSSLRREELTNAIPPNLAFAERGNPRMDRLLGATESGPFSRNEPLGNSFRRSGARSSSASTRRDRLS